MKNSNLKALVAKTKKVNNPEFMALNDKLASVIKGGKKPATATIDFGCTHNDACC